MTLSRGWALGGIVSGVLAFSSVAVALNAPHTLHRVKPQPHLSTSHRTSTRHTASHTSKSSTAVHTSSAAARAVNTRTGKALVAGSKATLHTAVVRRHRYYERFTASSFATSDIFTGDKIGGEDPVVRQAAIDALDGMNGTAVVIDPSNGRILAMVNQKLALSPGAEPCSTIKLTVALAALSEGLVTRDTPVQLAGFRMNMTQALAKSNNLYFEELGRELGFERVPLRHPIRSGRAGRLRHFR